MTELFEIEQTLWIIWYAIGLWGKIEYTIPLLYLVEIIKKNSFFYTVVIIYNNIGL